MRGRRPGHGHARGAAELALSALALVLALGSSVVWGSADFAGGSLTKRLPTFSVTVVSQAAGFVVLLLVAGLRGDVGAHSFALGLLAGIGGGAGLAAFYRALSLGTMSVVSPVVACGAVVPFAISIATGERPSGLALAGAVAALGGAVLASVEERRASSPERARAIALAVVAAVALGLFVYFLGLGSRQGDALSTLLGARVGSLTLLIVVAAGRRASLRVPRRWLLAVAAVGLADVTANILFAFAAGHALLSLVSVLGSLYPVVTVLLAHVLLGERLTRPQRAGVAVALAGVAAIAGG
ncbi:MAG TPA: EamA family transporter [Gaiellaceae bacterium]|nr:EamA family transporter [Gaiellaceae bacterium]